MKKYAVNWQKYPENKPQGNKANGAFVSNNCVIFPILVAIDYPSGQKAVWSAFYDVYEDYFYVGNVIVENVRYFAYIPKIERP